MFVRIYKIYLIHSSLEIRMHVCASKGQAVFGVRGFPFLIYNHDNPTENVTDREIEESIQVSKRTTSSLYIWLTFILNE